jgi:phosphoribosylformylglycinamidine cyclo-ligase
VDEAEMYRVFNMGIGFVIIASPYYAESIQRQLSEDRVRAWLIGEVRPGESGLEFE